jgi:hypothetical protein
MNLHSHENDTPESLQPIRVATFLEGLNETPLFKQSKYINS